MRHFTHAEIASESKERTPIQMNEPSRIPVAMKLLSSIHCQPERLACTKNSTRPGIQVIHDKMITRTDIFPTTYSVLESGRHRYRVSAPLARSGDTRLGPMNDVRMNASVP